MSATAELMYANPAIVGPHEYETSPAFQLGWSAGAMVGAIVELTDLLADEHVLAVVDGDDWDRRWATTKARGNVERLVVSLRTALDVLDPAGSCSSRERLVEAGL